MKVPPSPVSPPENGPMHAFFGGKFDLVTVEKFYICNQGCI